ncbi:MAG: RNA 3'-phosphate cyclase [Nitrospirae bacterium]|nr:RNA 3'-phosphate cyclase [Nitrospirota bacterium]
MLKIDGAQYSGSGTIVRQAVAFAALTGQAVHIVNARIRRPKPGLRPQHIRVVNAISQLVGGTTEGVHEGSRELVFRPGNVQGGREYCWDIGSAGSTTMLALAVLPVLAFRPAPSRVELRGGLFQDFAPSMYHVQQVVLPLLHRMGLTAELEMERPGYVPRGDGILFLNVKPARQGLHHLVLDQRGAVERLWGIALASHLEERRVSHRMAESAHVVFAAAGYQAEIEVRYDTSAPQPGAALAAFADCAGRARLGADRAGALRRTAESIGKYVARQLLDDLATGATLDRFTADQIFPFAALATGESRFAIPMVTDHVRTSAWLAKTFLGAESRIDDHGLTITGTGFRPDQSDAA